ncbi:MAG: xanthine dehydrogenase family protein molybdopterin-binding subunit, partial [Ilumatobacteraceae bacterium]
DWPLMIPVGGTTSFGGDVLAVVVADTREHARAAAELIEVEYTVHSPVTDAKAALASDSPIAVWGTDSNVLSVSAYQRDVGVSIEDALASSAHVVSETFTTQRIEHAFLEPESTLAVPSGDGEQKTLHVYSGGQGVWDDRNDIAAILGVERERVTVELVSNGGAFGGKEDMSNQGHAALAAWLLGQPVKCTLSRVESFRMHAKRHPITLDVRAGCDADGVLTGLHVRAIGDSGAYASVGMKVLERAAGHVAGPYRWQSLDIEATAVRTNNPICGAFRGFGANQAQFATEGVIDRLAELAGIDPWEFRSKNVITPGDTWGPGQIMDDGAGGARECLDAIKPDYDRARSEGRSVGLAIGMKNSGLGNGFREVCGAVVHFRDDGRIEVRHGWTEMGQGVHTVALQVAAQELNVDAERIDVIVDTTRELGFGQTTGSRGTLMTAGSVAAACQAALAANCEVGVDHHGEYVVDWTHHLGDPEHPNPTIHSCFSYAAQLVEIDNASGAIDRVLAVHDVGKAVNPTLVEGQIEGSVHMGLGYALTEDFPSDETGMPAVDTLRQLGILRAKDIPKIDVKVVEVPQPRSPYGIKGVGEIGLVPTAPAVAAALYDFDGDRRRTLPMRRQ